MLLESAQAGRYFHAYLCICVSDSVGHSMRDYQNLICVLCLLAVPLVGLPVTMQSSLGLLFEGPESFASRVGQYLSDFSTKGKSPLYAADSSL